MAEKQLKQISLVHFTSLKTTFCIPSLMWLCKGTCLSCALHVHAYYICTHMRMCAYAHT